MVRLRAGALRHGVVDAYASDDRGCRKHGRDQTAVSLHPRVVDVSATDDRGAAKSAFLRNLRAANVQFAAINAKPSAFNLTVSAVSRALNNVSMEHMRRSNQHDQHTQFLHTKDGRTHSET